MIHTQGKSSDTREQCQDEKKLTRGSADQLTSVPYIPLHTPACTADSFLRKVPWKWHYWVTGYDPVTFSSDCPEVCISPGLFSYISKDPRGAYT